MDLFRPVPLESFFLDGEIVISLEHPFGLIFHGPGPTGKGLHDGLWGDRLQVGET